MISSRFKQAKRRHEILYLTDLLKTSLQGTSKIVE
jgi:hypothetical protein